MADVCVSVSLYIHSASNYTHWKVRGFLHIWSHMFHFYTKYNFIKRSSTRNTNNDQRQSRCILSKEKGSKKKRLSTHSNTATNSPSLVSRSHVSLHGDVTERAVSTRQQTRSGMHSGNLSTAWRSLSPVKTRSRILIFCVAMARVWHQPNVPLQKGVRRLFSGFDDNSVHWGVLTSNTRSTPTEITLVMIGFSPFTFHGLVACSSLSITCIYQEASRSDKLLKKP